MKKRVAIGVTAIIVVLGLLAIGGFASGVFPGERSSYYRPAAGTEPAAGRTGAARRHFVQTGNGPGSPGSMGRRASPNDTMGNTMGVARGYYQETPTPLPHEAAREIVENYLNSLNSSDLRIGEFEEYSHNYYVSLVERNGGRGAFEIIIDRYSGDYRLEPQSMAWNEEYGMMGGGMMGRTGNRGMMGNQQGGGNEITSGEAMEIAADFLGVVYPGTYPDEIVAYYGYYTVMTAKDGEHYGMLSVNGYSGDVWYHTWHGSYISEVEEH